MIPEVPEGASSSELERWCKGPAKPSGRNLERALTRVAEISATGLGTLDLDAAMATVSDLVPPPGGDDERAMRAELATRIITVSGFLKTLTEVIDFEGNADAADEEFGESSSTCVFALTAGLPALATVASSQTVLLRCVPGGRRRSPASFLQKGERA